MAERTGKCYLSYQELLFFCQAFLFVRLPEGPSFSFCSAGSISFTPNIKELTLLVNFFPSSFFHVFVLPLNNLLYMYLQ